MCLIRCVRCPDRDAAEAAAMKNRRFSPRVAKLVVLELLWGDKGTDR